MRQLPTSEASLDSESHQLNTKIVKQVYDHVFVLKSLLQNILYTGILQATYKRRRRLETDSIMLWIESASRRDQSLDF